MKHDATVLISTLLGHYRHDALAVKNFMLSYKYASVTHQVTTISLRKLKQGKISAVKWIMKLPIRFYYDQDVSTALSPFVLLLFVAF